MGNMIMKFVGTGAGEGIPTPFCRCRICENARKVKGREIRLRSCFRVADDLQIDLGPDTLAESLLYDNDLYDLEYLLVTHTHQDHFIIDNLFLKSMISRGSGKKLNVYFTGEAIKLLEGLERAGFDGKENFFQACLEDHIVFHRLEFWKESEIGPYRVTPVQGAHRGHFEENCANYIIVLPNGQKMLYALDTGFYSDTTLDFLKGRELDFFMVDCTFGSLKRGDTPYSHLDMVSVNHLAERLYQQRTLTERTHVFLTHINQEQDYTHEQMTDYYSRFSAPYAIQVAYDGLTVGHLLR